MRISNRQCVDFFRIKLIFGRRACNLLCLLKTVNTEVKYPQAEAGKHVILHELVQASSGVNIILEFTSTQDARKTGSLICRREKEERNRDGKPLKPRELTNRTFS